MPKHHDELPFNPFIHGTSSQTLSMMQDTDFQLMPVIAMLQDFKVAPMVGELTKGGFDIIGDGSNCHTITGAPAFGRMQHHRYNLNAVIRSYTNHPKNTNLNTCKENLKALLANAHKSAFTNLNLLMIYLVRLRQLGIKAADIAPLDETNTLKKRLKATVQFYYFILCIHKYIFIDGAEIERFQKENQLDAVDDYIEHYFSFENFLEKINKTGFNIEEIYNAPNKENINQLIEFFKISKDSQENVKRYPSGEDHFIAKSDYHFFTPHRHELKGKIYYVKIGGYLFGNTSGFTLSHYLEQHHKAYKLVQEDGEQAVKSLKCCKFKMIH